VGQLPRGGCEGAWRDAEGSFGGRLRRRAREEVEVATVGGYEGRMEGEYRLNLTGQVCQDGVDGMGTVRPGVAGKAFFEGLSGNLGAQGGVV